MAGMYCLADLLHMTVKESADELRLATGKPPVIVVGGQQRTLDLPELSAENVVELFSSFATSEQREELRRCGDIRFNYMSVSFGQFAVKASTEQHHLTLKMKPL
jgi:Tfp pilus assembly pilus retraction ATPase PilT